MGGHQGRCHPVEESAGQLSHTGLLVARQLPRQLLVVGTSPSTVEINSSNTSVFRQSKNTIQIRGEPWARRLMARISRIARRPVECHLEEVRLSRTAGADQQSVSPSLSSGGQAQAFVQCGQGLLSPHRTPVEILSILLGWCEGSQAHHSRRWCCQIRANNGKTCDSSGISQGFASPSSAHMAQSIRRMRRTLILTYVAIDVHQPRR
jgi:hypothetical protein